MIRCRVAKVWRTRCKQRQVYFPTQLTGPHLETSHDRIRLQFTFKKCDRLLFFSLATFCTSAQNSCYTIILSTCPNMENFLPHSLRKKLVQLIEMVELTSEQIKEAQAAGESTELWEQQFAITNASLRVALLEADDRAVAFLQKDELADLDNMTPA